MMDMPHYLLETDTATVEAFHQAPQSAQATPAENLQPESLYAMIEENEKKQIMDALLQAGGNVSKAACALGCSRQSLTYRMKKYGIHR